MNRKEYDIQKQLNKLQQSKKQQIFAKVYTGGQFSVSLANVKDGQMPEQSEGQLEHYSFIVMEPLGISLSTHLINNNGALCTNEVCQIGIALLDQLEMLHSIGKIYNDLKMDNVLISPDLKPPRTLNRYTLIDFGLCSDYLESNGDHKTNENQGMFQGNLALASANALEYMTTSRKDDLISLLYLLIYLLQGHLNQLSYTQKANQDEKIK